MKEYYSHFYRKSAAFLWGYFCSKSMLVGPTILNVCEKDTPVSANMGPPNRDPPNTAQNKEIFAGYTSDWTDDGDGNQGDDEEDTLDNGDPTEYPAIEMRPNGVAMPVTSADMALSWEISPFGIME